MVRQRQKCADGSQSASPQIESFESRLRKRHSTKQTELSPNKTRLWDRINNEEGLSSESQAASTASTPAAKVCRVDSHDDVTTATSKAANCVDKEVPCRKLAKGKGRGKGQGKNQGSRNSTKPELHKRPAAATTKAQRSAATAKTRKHENRMMDDAEAALVDAAATKETAQDDDSSDDGTALSKLIGQKSAASHAAAPVAAGPAAVPCAKLEEADVSDNKTVIKKELDTEESAKLVASSEQPASTAGSVQLSESEQAAMKNVGKKTPTAFKTARAELEKNGVDLATLTGDELKEQIPEASLKRLFAAYGYALKTHAPTVAAKFQASCCLLKNWPP